MGTHKLETAREGQVRKQKGGDWARGTHKLEMAEAGRSQDTEKRQSKGCALSRDGRGRNNSGNRKNMTEQGALTFCRPQREGQVRTRKESN